MTARSTRPEAMLRSAKREDLTPKKKRTVRGTNTGRGTAVARSRGINTSTSKGAMSVSPDKPLTDKQRQFVKLWASGESITSASVRAGYNDAASIAYRMTLMPNVLKLYNEEKAKFEEAAQMTRKKVMDGFLESIEMAKLMSEPMSMVAGWREVGKMCGYYAPVEHRMKVDVSGNVTYNRLNSMSDSELLEMIQSNKLPALPAPDVTDVTPK